MKELCLDVPKALKTIISCEALHQECGAQKTILRASSTAATTTF